MKITKYVSVAADNLKQLDEAVNDYIAQGFQPFGNPYISDAKDTGAMNPFLFVQALVKYES